MVAIAKRLSTDIEHITLWDVPWELYEQLLEVAGNKRLTYNEGTLEIMSPLPIHETIKKMLAGMVELFALELDLPLARRGSTTFKSRMIRKGLEPDECYYVKNARRVRGLERIDLDIHPPPDLVIEVDITNDSMPRQPIYERLGVPELWRFDGEQLHVLHLVDGQYQEAERSRAFPMLDPHDFLAFLARLPHEDENAIMRQFQRWVRERFGSVG